MALPRQTTCTSGNAGRGAGARRRSPRRAPTLGEATSASMLLREQGLRRTARPSTSACPKTGSASGCADLRQGTSASAATLTADAPHALPGEAALAGSKNLQRVWERRSARIADARLMRLQAQSLSGNELGEVDFASQRRAAAVRAGSGSCGGNRRGDVSTACMLAADDEPLEKALLVELDESGSGRSPGERRRLQRLNDLLSRPGQRRQEGAARRREHLSFTASRRTPRRAKRTRRSPTCSPLAKRP